MNYNYELERRLKFIDSPIISNASRDYSIKTARLLKKRIKVIRDLCYKSKTICVVSIGRKYAYVTDSSVDILVFLPSLKLYNMYQKMGIKLFDWLIKYLDFSIKRSK